MRPIAPPLLSILVGLAACASPTAPIWLIPADPAIGVADGTARARDVLADLGYEAAEVDPELGIIETEWRFDRDLIESARYRALLRVKSDAPFAVAVSVPREVHDGRRWVPQGENESRRQTLVAMLTARLSPRPPDRER